MNTFKAELAIDAESLQLRFGDRTLGLNPTESGFTCTPDWSEKRFTVAEADAETRKQCSHYFHVTSEGGAEEKIDKGHFRTEDEFALGMYETVRGFGNAFPLSEFTHPFLLRLDTDGVMDIFAKSGVIEESGDVTRLDFQRMAVLQERLVAEWSTAEIISAMYDIVLVSEARVSADELYFSPVTGNRVFLFPDGYVIEVAPDEPLNIGDVATDKVSRFIGQFETVLHDP